MQFSVSFKCIIFLEKPFPVVESAAATDQLRYTCEVVLPRSSSVWVANDKKRSIVFNYAGEEMDSWNIRLIRKDGVVIRELLEEILIQVSTSSSTASSTSSSSTASSSSSQSSSSPSLSSPVFTFEKSITVNQDIQTDKYFVEVCGNVIGSLSYGSKTCTKSKQFVIEGKYRARLYV
jgi:PKD repeat protein